MKKKRKKKKRERERKRIEVGFMADLIQIELYLNKSKSFDKSFTSYLSHNISIVCLRTNNYHETRNHLFNETQVFMPCE